MEGKRVRWAFAKQELMKDFSEWISECDFTRENNPKDMIEFLYQKGFIKGKKWRNYIGKLADKQINGFWIMYEPLCEGKIPPNTWV